MSQVHIFLGGPSPARRPGLLRKLAATVVGAVVLAGAFMISVAVLAVLAVAGVIGGAWLWWRTRELRKRVREHVSAQEQAQGRVIEGEVIRDPN